MTNHGSSDRRSWWGAGLCLFTIGTLGVAACSSDHAGTVSSTVTTAAARPAAAVTTGAAPTTAPPTTTPAAPAAPASAAPPAPDPAATLRQAVASLTTTYHFASTVTLDGTVALVADGDRVGDGSRLTLTSNDGDVAYVITPDGSWVQPDGGDWQPIDTDPANTDPISALQAPASVQLTSSDGTTAHLAVAVAPGTLGLPGDAPVQLDVAIAGTALASVSYATTVGTKSATVTATFGPAHDATPVTAPA
jgi:hypothetical protein